MALPAIASRFQTTRTSAATARMKNKRGSATALTIPFRKPTTPSVPRPLERTRDASVLADAPEMDRHQHGDAKRQADAVQYVEPQQRAFADKRAAEQREPSIVGR